MLNLCKYCLVTRAVDENDHAGNEASHCAYVDNPVSTELHSGELTVGIIEEIRVVSASAQASTNGTEWCTKERESCYTLWFIDPVNKSKITMLKQGKLAYLLCFHSGFWFMYLCYVTIIISRGRTEGRKA